MDKFHLHAFIQIQEVRTNFGPTESSKKSTVQSGEGGTQRLPSLKYLSPSFDRGSRSLSVGWFPVPVHAYQREKDAENADIPGALIFLREPSNESGISFQSGEGARPRTGKPTWL